MEIKQKTKVFCVNKLNKMDKKMSTKNILVSFLAVVAVFALVATVSAHGDVPHESDFDVTNVKIDDVSLGLAPGTFTQVVQAGEEVALRVYFNSNVDDRDVTVTVTVDTGRDKTEAETTSFRVAHGSSYTKGLVVKVPYELSDDLSDDVTLEIEIEGEDADSTVEYKFTVERPQYAFGIKSVSTDQQISAGETFPVEVVVKNVGYYDLDDVYVTVSIPELNVQKTGYFDDLFAIDGEEDMDDNDEDDDNECDDDEDCEDTLSGKLYLEVPQDAKSGVYNLEVKVQNDDVSSTRTVQVAVENNFDNTVIKSGNSLWIVNPTNNVVGYRIVPESPATVSESVVFVPAGASAEVEVMANAEGEYGFDVNVFAMNGDLVSTVSFTGEDNGTSDDDSDTTDPIVILTVILAIIFVVLLVVLIVLIGKKPEKSSEFGESYY